MVCSCDAFRAVMNFSRAFFYPQRLSFTVHKAVKKVSSCFSVTSIQSADTAVMNSANLLFSSAFILNCHKVVMNSAGLSTKRLFYIDHNSVVIPSRFPL